MDIRMTDKTIIYNIDTQEERFAKAEAKMDRFYAKGFAHEEKALNVSCKIGVAKGCRTIGQIMIIIAGFPVGIYLGIILAKVTLSIWWAIIFP